ncbi:MAG: hypothetical protein JRJ59_10075 [Deltaproteobacteria bacterium]|nr:hypothetical protein [Deltaproteobacteria bacterium]
MLLPLAMNLLASASAAAAAETRGFVVRPVSEEYLLQESFGLLGQEMVRKDIGVEHLDHHLIEALVDVAPLVAAVEGASRYEVWRVEDEENLFNRIGEAPLFGKKEVLEHLKAQTAQEVPFYVVHPDRQSFKGVALQMAQESFSDDYWDFWFEAYGPTWRGLNYHHLELREGVRGEPLVELPLLEGDGSRGWLHHFYVRYLEWDHGRPLEEQLLVTANAIGKNSVCQDLVSSRYFNVVSQFNKALVAEGVLWADWLLALAPRSWPLHTPNKVIANLLEKRTRQLLKLKKTGPGQTSLEDIAQALEKVWPDLDQIEAEEDERRWELLYQTLKKALA